tara:strand:+ start:2763 stop:2936 length:174 start_codon:yes stop_codon:yes gene_type:complete
MSTTSTTWVVDINTDDTSVSVSSTTTITIGDTKWTYDVNSNAASSLTTSWVDETNTE